MRTALLIVALILLPLTVAAEDEYLPTPYTADEIRDAWVEGFEVLTRSRTAAGESFSRTRVVASDDAGFTMIEIETDENGQPRPDSEPARYSGAWEDLRNHARFPAARASRDRTEWETPLGHLQGWLYLVEGDSGVSEFFFADGLPGPPVVYRKDDGPDGFVAEQLSRGVRDFE